MKCSRCGATAPSIGEKFLWGTDIKSVDPKGWGGYSYLCKRCEYEMLMT